MRPFFAHRFMLKVSPVGSMANWDSVQQGSGPSRVPQPADLYDHLYRYRLCTKYTDHL